MGRRSLKSQCQRRAYKKHEARMKRTAERRITMIKSFSMPAVSVCNRPAAHDPLVRTRVQEPIDHDRSDSIICSPVLPTPGSPLPSESQASWSVSEGDACINEANQSGATQVNYEEELPIVVVDKQRSLEVHLSPELQGIKGAEVLRLSTEEYFSRIQQQEEE